jgi:hypothetical protein
MEVEAELDTVTRLGAGGWRSMSSVSIAGCLVEEEEDVEEVR